MISFKDSLETIENFCDNPAKLFLILASVFGLLFVFLFPPFQVIDEPSHFFRSYQIAEGHIVGQKIDNKSGGDLPVSVPRIADHYGYLFFHYDQKVHKQTILDDLGAKPERSKREFTTFNNTVIYPAVTYLPQAVGIKISMLFNASPLVSLYAARLVSLAFWIACLYWVIRIIPAGKWVVFVLGLFPMMLSQAASASADATINSLCFLTVGLIVSMLAKRSISTKKLYMVLALGIALALTKIPYFLVLMLASAIPNKNFPSSFSKRKFLTILFGSTVVIALVWNYFMNGIHVDLRPDTSTHEQMKFLLSNPLIFIKAAVLYPLTVQVNTTFTQIYGLLGWNEIGLPVWLIIYGYLALAAAFLDTGFKKFVIDAKTRFIAFAAFFAGAFSITILLYLSWMPVGFKYIYDLWGRYFSALLILLIPMFGGLIFADAKSWKRIRFILAATAPLALAVVSILVWNRYYFHLRFN